jgi:hypothetical protein
VGRCLFRRNDVEESQRESRFRLFLAERCFSLLVLCGIQTALKQLSDGLQLRRHSEWLLERDVGDRMGVGIVGERSNVLCICKQTTATKLK